MNRDGNSGLRRYFGAVYMPLIDAGFAAEAERAGRGRGGLKRYVLGGSNLRPTSCRWSD